MGEPPLHLGLLRGNARRLATLWVRLQPEVLEELPREHVPPPLQPHFPQVPRQGFQLGHIFRLRGHQRLVVLHQCLDEHIVLRVLAALEPAVDEYPLDVGVPLAAGVAGEIHPLREAVHAAQAGRNGPHLELGQLRGLVQEDHVILHALEPVQVPVPLAVHEVDDAAVEKPQHLVPVVVFGHAQALLPQGVDVVVDQLRIAPPHDQQADARIPQGQQLGLGAHAPALSAAACPAVAHIPVPLPQKKLLLGVGLVDGDLHSL